MNWVMSSQTSGFIDHCISGRNSITSIIYAWSFHHHCLRYLQRISFPWTTTIPVCHSSGIVAPIGACNDSCHNAADAVFKTTTSAYGYLTVGLMISSRTLLCYMPPVRFPSPPSHCFMLCPYLSSSPSFQGYMRFGIAGDLNSPALSQCLFSIRAWSIQAGLLNTDIDINTTINTSRNFSKYCSGAGSNTLIRRGQRVKGRVVLEIWKKVFRPCFEAQFHYQWWS